MRGEPMEVVRLTEYVTREAMSLGSLSRPGRLRPGGLYAYQVGESLSLGWAKRESELLPDAVDDPETVLGLATEALCAAERAYRAPWIEAGTGRLLPSLYQLDETYPVGCPGGGVVPMPTPVGWVSIGEAFELGELGYALSLEDQGASLVLGVLYEFLRQRRRWHGALWWSASGELVVLRLSDYPADYLPQLPRKRKKGAASR